MAVPARLPTHLCPENRGARAPRSSGGGGLGQRSVWVAGRGAAQAQQAPGPRAAAQGQLHLLFIFRF